MLVRWREAVIEALERQATRGSTAIVTREGLVADELGRIVRDTGSSGVTPQQTMSRILQELRDERRIEFLRRGRYLMLDRPLDVTSAEVDGESLERALDANLLRFPSTPASDAVGVAKRRRGQGRLRRRCRKIYGGRCGVCDVTDRRLLVTSHVARWADAPERRGDLRNAICLCSPHDALFEHGYWSLTDDLEVVKRSAPTSGFLAMILDATTEFTAPSVHPPDAEMLAAHRRRVGLS